MESEPKVSIVLPTYNGASRQLDRSIKSCLGQSYGNLELIIVDDCSSDHTPDVVKSFADHRIRYIRHEKNLRLPNALNTGFRNSTGQFLTWTSDDNEYLPGAIEHMVASLRNCKEADFVYADYYAFYEQSGRMELRRLPDQPDLAKKNCIGPCFLYTRQVYEGVGDYDERYELVEDYDYWIRVSRQFEMLHCPKALYVYREHSRSLKSTRTNSIVLFDSILKFERHYISIGQLARAVYQYNSAILRSEETLRRSAAIWHETLLRAFDLSFRLGLLFTLLSGTAAIVGAFKRLMARAASVVNDTLEPSRFLFTYYRLKSGHGDKNILCLSPSLLPGGAQAVVLNLAKALTPKGYDFHIVTVRRKDNHWYEPFRSVFKNVIMLSPQSGEDRYQKYVIALIGRLRIDMLLISNSSEGYRCVSRLASAFPHLKIVDILHAENWVGSSDEFLWVAPYLHRRVCVSRRLRDYMLKRYQAFGMDARLTRRLKVIHNGVDDQKFTRQSHLQGRFRLRFGIPEGTKIIAYIGRFSSEKQPLLFVDIAEQLSLATPPNTFKFVMAGDGQQFRLVRERISSSRLKHSFILTGLTNDIEQLLADTHLLLVVSESEGMPLVILESMAMSVPVISSQVGAIHEVIEDGVNGGLIPPADDIVHQYTSRVLGLLGDDEMYATLSKNARGSIVPQYSLETMGRRYENVFEEMSKGDGARGEIALAPKKPATPAWAESLPVSGPSVQV